MGLNSDSLFDLATNVYNSLKEEDIKSYFYKTGNISGKIKAKNAHNSIYLNKF